MGTNKHEVGRTYHAFVVDQAEETKKPKPELATGVKGQDGQPLKVSSGCIVAYVENWQDDVDNAQVYAQALYYGSDRRWYRDDGQVVEGLKVVGWAPWPVFERRRFTY